MAFKGVAAPNAQRDQRALSARNLFAEVGKLATVNSNLAPTSQQIYGSLLGLEAGDIVTNIWVAVQTAAAGSQPTRMEVALLDSSFNRLATSGNVKADAAWTSTGPKALALTAPYTVTAAGGFYCCVLQDGSWGSTALQLARWASSSGSALLPSGGIRTAFSQVGQSTVPNPVTPSDGSGVTFWFGVS